MISQNIEGIFLHLSHCLSMFALDGDALLENVYFFSGAYNSIVGILNFEFVVDGESRFDDLMIEVSNLLMIPIFDLQIGVEVQHFLMCYSNEMVMSISELEDMVNFDNFFLNASKLFSMFVFEFHVHLEMEKFLFGFELVRNDEIGRLHVYTL